MHSAERTQFERVAIEQRGETEVLLEHKRWQDWRRALTAADGSGPVADAIKQIRCLAFPGEINQLPEDRRPREEWSEYFSSKWAEMQQRDAEQIHDDFARFARATDVIINALEDLPVKKPGVSQ